MRVFTFASLPAEMRLVAQRRSLRQTSTLQMTSARAFRSPDPSGPVPGAPSRLRPPIRLAASGRRTGMGLRHVLLAYADSRWFRRKAHARTVPLAWRRLALALALAGPARRRLRRCCSSRAGVWPFPPFTGERKRSQTLNFLGGNTSWLTHNPSRSDPSARRGVMSIIMSEIYEAFIAGRPSIRRES